MPAVYSLDLRKRVVAAVDAGEGTQAQIAARFCVSLGWVEKLLRQRRRSGHIAPIGHRGGAPRRLDESALEAVRAAVTARPDIALEELRLRTSTLWHWSRVLGLPRKKRRS